MRRWALMGLFALALGGCGGSSAVSPRTQPPPAVRTPTPTAVATQPPPAPPPKRKPKPKPKPKPGSLPQTHQLPSPNPRAFHAEMAALWAGVQANSAAKATPAFFPEDAYVQVKAIGDPRGDYAGRLLVEYRLDLAAAHGLLGANPGAARLLRVEVPEGYAHWVDPNVCANRVGYYEVPNTRLVYRQNGTVRSFGIASMISWRGVWYVIHLGAVLRSGGGVVDDPSAGPGSSVPSSTC